MFLTIIEGSPENNPWFLIKMSTKNLPSRGGAQGKPATVPNQTSVATSKPEIDTLLTL